MCIRDRNWGGTVPTRQNSAIRDLPRPHAHGMEHVRRYPDLLHTCSWIGARLGVSSSKTSSSSPGGLLRHRSSYSLLLAKKQLNLDVEERSPLVDDHHLTGLGYRHRHPLPNRWSRVRLPSISACYPLRPQITDRRHVYSGCECSPRRRVATMILLETLNLAPHFHSVLDNPPESFTKVQWVMVGNVLATLIAAVILADSIARILDEKRREATAFSEKMNLRADKLALLLRVGTAISKSSDFGKVVHNALEDIHHHFEAESTVLYLSDPETHRVKGLEALGDAAGREIQETTLATATLEAMQPRLSSVTIPGEEGEKEQRSVMVAPLIVENTGYGAIKMIAPKGPAFNKSKLALLNTVSGELASTLRTADTYQETNSNLSHATQELTALTSFTRKVSSSQEVEEIAERLLVTAQKLTSADHGFVALFPNIQAEDRNDAEEAFTIAHYPREIADRLKTRARGEFKG